MNAAPRGLCLGTHGRASPEPRMLARAGGTTAALHPGMMHALWMSVPAALAVTLFVATLRLQGSR